MTVSYNFDVSSVGSFTFLKLLLRWKGSIFKSVYTELFVWTVSYFFITIIYRFALSDNQQKTFEAIGNYLDTRLIYIPLTFMLGFFVTIVIDRWRNVLLNMHYIDNCAVQVASLIRGKSEEVRLIRRSIIRYLCLAQVMLFRDISIRVRRRFPNMESLIDAGFLFEDELERLESFQFDYNKYWMPVNWAMSLIARSTFPAKTEPHRQYVDCGTTLNQILNVVRGFRSSIEALSKYDLVPIPIAYPQVVFLAVRSYFVICLISRQCPVHGGPNCIAFPFMTILEFIFFVGWMKVAEALLNPMGEDDDDFECNWLIDKNIATGMAIVDEHYDNPPALRLDVFADPTWKPVYSEDSVAEAPVNQGGSVANVELPGAHERVKMVPVEPIHKSSEAGTFRRKLSMGFSRPRANSMQPSHLIWQNQNGNGIEAPVSAPKPKMSNGSILQIPNANLTAHSNDRIFHGSMTRVDEETEYKEEDENKNSEIYTDLPPDRQKL